MKSSHPTVIGILAGELSGDLLGEAVMREFCKRHTNTSITGVGGRGLTDAGLQSLFPMERLSVFGFVDPLKRLPELLNRRRSLTSHFKNNPPDLFLGIDSPDFNLTLEKRLRRQGIPTAHLVSPSVWAWRSRRIESIRKSVDLMLCLLPFEKAFYDEQGVPAVCVGHPMVEDLANLPTKAAARKVMSLNQKNTVLAFLPGSRQSEVAHLLPVFTAVAARFQQLSSGITIVIPAANSARLSEMRSRGLHEVEGVLLVEEGQSRLSIVAADAVLCASGTATLEAMLIGRPMVVAYRMAWLTWQLLSKMVHVPYVGLPNVLAGQRVVPELLQNDATEDKIYEALNEILSGAGKVQLEIFKECAEAIGPDFARRSVDALESLLWCQN